MTIKNYFLEMFFMDIPKSLSDFWSLHPDGKSMDGCYLFSIEDFMDFNDLSYENDLNNNNVPIIGLGECGDQYICLSESHYAFSDSDLNRYLSVNSFNDLYFLMENHDRRVFIENLIDPYIQED